MATDSIIAAGIVIRSHCRMRLTPEQIQLIKAVVVHEFDPDVRIWLFGSRADDLRRGGDIDLYVETSHPELLRELRCKLGIEEAVDLHVDLIVAQPGDDRPISRIAKNEGIRL
jgi:predicted nucleotidyltransferase